MKTLALGAALMLFVCTTSAVAEEPAATDSTASNSIAADSHAANSAAPAATASIGASSLTGVKSTVPFGKPSAGPIIGSETPEFGTLAKKTAYSLAALTLFFLLATGTIKRFSKNTTAAGSEHAIEILSRKALGPRQSLIVVSVAGRSFFVSQSPEGVSLISELDEEPIFRAASTDDLELLENMKSSQRG